MSTFIIHHNDLDGYISGDIVKTKNPDAICLECSYDLNNEPDVTSFQKNDMIYIVDYSLKPDKMIWLKNNINIVWIDHHISAINDSKKYGYDDIKGIREVGKSAAELCYKYFYSDKEENLFVKLVGEFDTYRNALDRNYFHGEVLPFFLGTELYMNKFNPSKFDIDYFKNFNELFVKKLQKIGKIIYLHQKKTYGTLVDDNAYVRNIWGYKVLCINNTGRGGMIFDIPNKFNSDKHDMMCVYHYNGKNWCYGFYCTPDKDVDCSKIAKLYGGGGHKSASGASTKSLIKELL